MKTVIVVIGDWGGFAPFELGNLKHIPRVGEHFDIDKKRYKRQAEIIENAVEKEGVVCRVNIVCHVFKGNTHTIEIHIACWQ